ncbi:hypothetical protein BCR33DRAFT_715528 [Rhizoclosmatium globosum]|uniref:Uncharacterized protein n=1 Tax=Rhizoclosmatium globosum TaxID=329046 RepID=A0A1Y2CHC8_9FUNG|nr:hypothetical protein BCR33DRAFT_715528 [Rhizoclosmatium globosum]|eukprot:ORY46450.1 hypothetical protein BCR33DRAFT_715528 [Rhizoclosmatium globosum]
MMSLSVHTNTSVPLSLSVSQPSFTLPGAVHVVQSASVPVRPPTTLPVQVASIAATFSSTPLRVTVVATLSRVATLNATQIGSIGAKVCALASTPFSNDSKTHSICAPTSEQNNITYSDVTIPCEYWRISGSAQNAVSITRRVTQPNRDSALIQELYEYENAAKPLKIQNSKVVSAGTTNWTLPSLPLSGSLSAKLDAIVIHLPINHHAFADPFQIDGLNKLNNDIEFVAYGEPDLEVSIEESEKARMNGVFVVIKEPPSQEGGYVTVPVLPATVYAVVPKDSEFLHSSVINPVISHLLKGSLRDSSKFVGLRQQSFVELPLESVESFSMKMPVGNSEDASWVLWTLSSVVIASCIYFK